MLHLSVSPQSVPPGQTFTVSISSAAPGEHITVYYVVFGTQVSVETKSVTADSYGNATTTFVAKAPTATAEAPLAEVANSDPDVVFAVGTTSGFSNPVEVIVVPTGLTAQPACYTLNIPPVPWDFASAFFSVTGAPPGAVVTFHPDGPNGPVTCTATADAAGNASCTGSLSVLQILNKTYTAKTTLSGVVLTSSSTLLPCTP